MLFLGAAQLEGTLKMHPPPITSPRAQVATSRTLWEHTQPYLAHTMTPDHTENMP